MGAGRVLFGCVLTASLIGGACSSFEEGAPGGTDAGAGVDASPGDAMGADVTSPLADAAEDVDAAGGGPTIPNGDFEADVGVGCGSGWQPSLATGVRDPTLARSPTTSCKVCATTTSSSGAVIFYTLDAPPPGLYSLEVWFRKSPANEAPAQNHVQITAFAGTDAVAYSTPVRAAADGSWTAGQTSLRIDASITRLSVDLGTWAASVGQCVVYDDVRLGWSP